jgi:hypothetical protein
MGLVEALAAEAEAAARDGEVLGDDLVVDQQSTSRVCLAALVSALVRR